MILMLFSLQTKMVTKKGILHLKINKIDTVLVLRDIGQERRSHSPPGLD